MRLRRSRKGRLVGSLALVAGILAAGAVALTAANTVPASKAGDGSGTITGFTISNVDYVLNATNPGNIDSVTFTTDTAPGTGATVKIKLVSSGSDWYSCTMSGTPAINASCTTTSPQATVSAANELRVVIAQ